MSSQQPSPAFIGASWIALVAGMGAFMMGLFNAAMPLNEKGYYFIIFMYGLFRPFCCKRVCATGSKAFPSPTFTTA